MKSKEIIYFLVFVMVNGCNYPKKNTTQNLEEAVNENKWVDQSKCFENIGEYIPEKGYELVKLNIYKNPQNESYFSLTCRYDETAYLQELNLNMDIESIEDLGQFNR
jgi:hypothetical protein